MQIHGKTIYSGLIGKALPRVQAFSPKAYVNPITRVNMYTAQHKTVTLNMLIKNIEDLQTH